jgi:AhpD family alkylhydroperoxidase
MIAVTSVNRCRYCAAFYDGVARLAGISCSPGR